jgi:hypothetical protein
MLQDQITYSWRIWIGRWVGHVNQGRSSHAVSLTEGWLSFVYSSFRSGVVEVDGTFSPVVPVRLQLFQGLAFISRLLRITQLKWLELRLLFENRLWF